MVAMKERHIQKKKKKKVRQKQAYRAKNEPSKEIDVYFLCSSKEGTMHSR